MSQVQILVVAVRAKKNRQGILAPNAYSLVQVGHKWSFSKCDSINISSPYVMIWHLKCFFCFRGRVPSALKCFFTGIYPADICLFKVNNRTTMTICSNLIIKTPNRHHWRRSGVFNFNFESISLIPELFLLLTLNK